MVSRGVISGGLAVHSLAIALGCSSGAIVLLLFQREGGEDLYDLETTK
jgi:hypothetical protein